MDQAELPLEAAADKLALEIATPAIFQEWKRRSATSKAWADYALLLNTFAEALRRAPLTLEQCAEIEIVTHLNAEFAMLSDVLLLIFPNGIMYPKTYEGEAKI